MEKSNKRAFSRILTHQTISMVPCDQYEKDGLWVTLTSVDVSQSGILFESPYEYMVGERYIIRFTGKNNKLYDEQLEIIRVEEIITDTQFNIGAKFVNEDVDIIKKLI